MEGSSQQEPKSRQRGCKAGHRIQSKRAATCQLTYANITSWSDKAADHLIHQYSDHDVAIASETHVQGTKLDKALRAMRHDAQRFPFFSPPVNSADSETGTNGGIIGGTRQMRQHCPTTEDTPYETAWQSTFTFMAATQLALQGTDILVMGAYHRGGLRDDMLAEAHRITRGGRLHFIYMADFNASPDEVRDSGWPDRLQASVITAGKDNEPTCQQGSHASCIDFAIVSDTLLPLIQSFTIDWAVPWGHHAAL